MIQAALGSVRRSGIIWECLPTGSSWVEWTVLLKKLWKLCGPQLYRWSFILWEINSLWSWAPVCCSWLCNILNRKIFSHPHACNTSLMRSWCVFLVIRSNTCSLAEPWECSLHAGIVCLLAYLCELRPLRFNHLYTPVLPPLLSFFSFMFIYFCYNWFFFPSRISLVLAYSFLWIESSHLLGIHVWCVVGLFLSLSFSSFLFFFNIDVLFQVLSSKVHLKSYLQHMPRKLYLSLFKEGCAC